MPLGPHRFDDDTARRLRDFEATPPADLWDAVERARAVPSPRRSLYWSLALLGLLFVAGVGWWQWTPVTIEQDAVDEGAAFAKTSGGSSAAESTQPTSSVSIPPSSTSDALAVIPRDSFSRLRTPGRLSAKQDTDGAPQHFGIGVGEAVSEPAKRGSVGGQTLRPYGKTGPDVKRELSLNATAGATTRGSFASSVGEQEAPSFEAAENVLTKVDATTSAGALELPTPHSAKPLPIAMVGEARFGQPGLPTGEGTRDGLKLIVGPTTRPVFPAPAQSATASKRSLASAERLASPTLRPITRDQQPQLGLGKFSPRPPSETWARSVRLSVGLANTQRSLVASKHDDSDYLLSRDTIETNQPDIVGTIGFEQTHRLGLRLRLAVGYQAYHRESSFLSAIVREATTKTVLHPTTGAVVRTDTVQRGYQIKSVTQNRQQTAIVTLGAGYEIPTNRAWRPYVLAEAGYEFLLATRGKLRDGAGDEVALDNVTEQWVNPRPGLRLGGSVGVDLAIAARWSAGARISYSTLGDLLGEADLLTSTSQLVSAEMSLSLRL